MASTARIGTSVVTSVPARGEPEVRRSAVSRAATPSWPLRMPNRPPIPDAWNTHRRVTVEQAASHADPPRLGPDEQGEELERHGAGQQPDRRGVQRADEHVAASGEEHGEHGDRGHRERDRGDASPLRTPRRRDLAPPRRRRHRPGKVLGRVDAASIPGTVF